MDRKLASIQRIDSLSPILNADAIEQATVMGWNLVVKKGEFVPGDLCVFFEIDSILPEKPWAEFMRARHFRVKTVKLRGVLSQGLALPLAVVDVLGGVGEDVTERLDVRKHEPIISDVRLMAGAFPSAIPKTDETRLQSLLAVPLAGSEVPVPVSSSEVPVPVSVSVLSEIIGKTIYISTKLDGMSTTFYRPPDGGPVIPCSRNWALKRTDDNLASKICDEYKMDELLPRGYALQGELCGPGIQKNRLGLTRPEFFVFNVFYDAGDHGFFMSLRGFQLFLENIWGERLKTVPIEEVLVGPDWTLDQWLARAEGVYAGTKNRKEGIVVRPVTETFSSVIGGRLSFKVISNSFLLKDEE